MYHPPMKNYADVIGGTTRAFVLTATCLLAAMPSFGQAPPAGGSSPGGGQPPGGQQPAQPATPGASYRIQSDMLAYQASDVIAERIAADVRNQRLVIYDGPTFENLQFYEAYSAELNAFESAYNQLSPPPAQPAAPAPGNSLQDFTAAASAAQTIVNTLAATRSSTEYGTQQTNLQSDALVSQLVHHLNGANAVIVPKLLLEAPSELGFSAVPPPDHCGALANSVPDQLACILKIRAQKATYVGFADLDKTFQSFVANLIGITVATTLAAPPAGGGGAAPATPGPVPTGNTAMLSPAK